MPIPAGSASYITTVFIQDSSSTTGEGLPGLLFNTSGLTCYYKRSNGTASVAITLASISTLGTFVSGGFKEIDAVNMPGLYEFDPPDAALASGATNVTFYFYGVAGMAATVLGMDLNVANLPVNVVQWNGTNVATPATAGIPDVNVKNINNVAAATPGASGGILISGSNAGTTTLGAFTVTGATIHTGTTTYTGAVTYSAAVTPFMIRTATAQAGTTANITLDASASATSALYVGEMIQIASGTGAGQTRVIANYNGATKAATVDRAWTTAPNNTSVFVIWPTDSPALNATLQVSANVAQVTILTGTAQAGSTANTIVLSAAALATNHIYVGDLVTTTGGVGLGQSRTIIAYNGTTKVATVDRNWTTTPTNTTTFNVLASSTPSNFSDQGVAQAGGATTITLQSTASTVDDLYNGSLVTILSGTGSGQTALITDYTGSSRGATVDPAWSVNPDSTSAYAVIPTAADEGSLTNVNVSTINGQIVNIDGNGNFLATLSDGVAHGGTPGSSTATYAGARFVLIGAQAGPTFDVTNTVGIALSLTGEEEALAATCTGAANAMTIVANDSQSAGVNISGGFAGVYIFANGSIVDSPYSGALVLECDEDAALSIIADTDGDGIRITPAGTNRHGITAAGGTVSGDAFHLTATDGSGIKAVGGNGKPAIVPGSLALGL